ncbi:hypothetical protein G9A89_000089 [Geosiphon pyriformis]|nr:hypothetical protein G9A89_000089 [Geosiphon pyriformis]
MSAPLLPVDILQEIVEQLVDDKKTLYICLFVSRLWCRIIIPVLWRRPFHLLHISNVTSPFKFRQLLTVCFWTLLNPHENTPIAAKTFAIPERRGGLTFNYIQVIQELQPHHVYLAVKKLFNNYRISFGIMNELLKSTKEVSALTVTSLNPSVLPITMIGEFFGQIINTCQNLRKLTIEGMGNSQIPNFSQPYLRGIDRPYTLERIHFRSCILISGVISPFDEWDLLENFELSFEGCEPFMSIIDTFLEGRMKKRIFGKKHVYIGNQKLGLNINYCLGTENFP